MCRMPIEGQEHEVPDMTALFDDVDRPKLEAEAFELFKTMEVGGCAAYILRSPIFYVAPFVYHWAYSRVSDEMT